jgi:L-serine dehydratase
MLSSQRSLAKLIEVADRLTEAGFILPIGVCDLFKIGIGPSSSHTIGPMKAAATFISRLDGQILERVARIQATTFGSLAWTGRGHATDKALILGLAGFLPDGIDPEEATGMFSEICETERIRLPDSRDIEFKRDRDIVENKVDMFSRHPNAMRFQVFDGAEQLLAEEVWFSIGGGFVEKDGAPRAEDETPPPFGFCYRSSDELLAVCRAHGCTISEIALVNEVARYGELSAIDRIDRIISAMMACIDRGLSQEGELPGGLAVRRRAKHLIQKAHDSKTRNSRASSHAFDYVSAFAIAVNEENAAGSRVVTAPTNGAAGVVPAVLRYYRDFCAGADLEGMRAFVLTASAIGGIIKRNASISGAEVGCQGEVGSAAAMASAGLAAALGGTNEQVENAGEIAMEHRLGMTCDPVGGLVQIPCIERNAFGAIKAINAASLALAGDGTHKVSLDQVIEAMRQTGADMNDKYRETSRGGLAVNVPEC